MCESGSETAGSNRLLLIDPSLPRVLTWTIRVSQGGEPSLESLTLAILILQISSVKGVSIRTDCRSRMSLQKVEKLCHADQDHYNALPDLLDRFQIGELVIPSGFVNEQNPGASLLLDQVRARAIPVRTIAAPITWGQAGGALHGTASSGQLAPGNSG